jgi:hypothetical protein
MPGRNKGSGLFFCIFFCLPAHYARLWRIASNKFAVRHGPRLQPGGGEGATARAFIRVGMSFALYRPGFTDADQTGSPPKSSLNPPIGAANPSPFGSATGIGLVYKKPAGEPAVPSVIFSAWKID